MHQNSSAHVARRRRSEPLLFWPTVARRRRSEPLLDERCLRAPVSTFLFSVIALSDVKHIHFSPKKAHHQVSASAFFISSVLGLNRASIGFDKDGPHYHGLGGRSAWGCEMPRGCFVFRHRRFKDPTLEGERDFVAVRRRSEFSFPISRLQPPFTGRLESRSNPSSLKHTWFKNGEIRVVFFVTNKDSND